MKQTGENMDLFDHKVVILAGGLGTRLAEETAVRPKPMVEIGGRPILWHIMKTYSQYGLRNFIVALGYKGDVIKQYFLNYCALSSDISIDLSNGNVTLMDGTAEPWNVTLVDTGLGTQTGGRILRLKKYLDKEPFFFATYGDGVANIDIAQQVEQYRACKRACMLTAVRPPSRFGALSLKDGQVQSFTEKPQAGEGWINGGFFIFSRMLFDFLSGDETILEREPLESLANCRELAAYMHTGFWHPMDTLRDVKRLNELWEKGEAPWKIW